MKYFDITLRKAKGSTSLVYPANYQAEIGDYAQSHLYYDDDNGTSKLLLCIEDTDAVNIVRDYVVELTEAQAKTISEQHETRTETITDEAKVRRIELKVARGQALTADEEKAINPLDSTPGFGMRKILADRIEDLKTLESKKVK